jgi:major membrane immunogen (membrane-anchored lipoprotein)
VKRLIALLLVFTMILVGCGADDSATTSNSSENEDLNISFL